VYAAVGLLVASETFGAKKQWRTHRVLEHAGWPATFRERRDAADEEGDV